MKKIFSLLSGPAAAFSLISAAMSFREFVDAIHSSTLEIPRYFDIYISDVLFKFILGFAPSINKVYINIFLVMLFLFILSIVSIKYTEMKLRDRGVKNNISDKYLFFHSRYYIKNLNAGKYKSIKAWKAYLFSIHHGDFLHLWRESADGIYRSVKLFFDALKNIFIYEIMLSSASIILNTMLVILLPLLWLFRAMIITFSLIALIALAVPVYSAALFFVYSMILPVLSIIRAFSKDTWFRCISRNYIKFNFYSIIVGVCLIVIVEQYASNN